ncbi:hypothetical protein CEQ27_29245 (plasmid) [Escherichia coli O104:H4]|uniref:ATPase, T2SS/T4P/T4SS family n=1 Tax=Escherichia coli TaxID=562 RepID=UPI000CFEDC52|nr:ATPase, T2SS/T4P/T4SS family [Escherichia coli]AVL34149.1 hypothetical protein CEQ27_29245 [Escherichia coli O104:H4]
MTETKFPRLSNWALYRSKSVAERHAAPPEGKIVLSGPTGSGNQQRYAVPAVYILTISGRHLLTIEDPLEGQILGATQTPIICDKSDEEAVKLAWSRAISSAMRLDPMPSWKGNARFVSMMSQPTRLRPVTSF